MKKILSSLILISSLVLPVTSFASDTLFEFQHPTVNDQNRINFDRQNNVPFLATSAHTVTSIKVQLYKNGSPTGTLTAGLYAVDGSHFPTGSALCSGTIAENTITDTAKPGSFYEATMGTPCAALTNGTEYGLWLGSTNTDDASNRALWTELDPPGNGITLPVSVTANQGSSWACDGGCADSALMDFRFEIYGIAAASPVPPSDANTLTLFGDW